MGIKTTVKAGWNACTRRPAILLVCTNVLQILIKISKVEELDIFIFHTFSAMLSDLNKSNESWEITSFT